MATTNWCVMILYTVNNNPISFIQVVNTSSSPNYSSISRLHKIYAFVIPTLVAFLQLQTATPSSSSSPFQAHPFITGASVFGILGYYLAFMACLRFPLYATHYYSSSISMGVFGSFSVASLSLLLLPSDSDSPACRYIQYIFCALLAVIELHPLLKFIMMMAMRRRMRSWPARNPTRNLLPRSRMDVSQRAQWRLLMYHPIVRHQNNATSREISQNGSSEGTPHPNPIMSTGDTLHSPW